MYKFCITIHGKRHCFDVPVLIDKSVIRRPPPGNFPALDLAASVLILTEAVPKSELSTELARVATAYIDQVKAGLPKGVELTQVKGSGATA
jgi:hypothetical protein